MKIRRRRFDRTAANIERSKFSLKRLTEVGEAIQDFEVRDEHVLTHSIVRTAHGWIGRT